MISSFTVYGRKRNGYKHILLVLLFSNLGTVHYLYLRGHRREIKKKNIYNYPTTQGVQNFFNQPLIEIQDFKAAFVNLTRNDCFICFCPCDFHVYVIKCVRLLAIIIHCNMFSFSHWSFFHPTF